MKEKKKLCGYYNYTVILTYLGMLIGFRGITLVLNQKYEQAMICLMGSGICDMFDGTIAATRKRNKNEKCFGIQIDSLSDLICFGVLPAIIVYSMSGQTTVALIISSLYTLCALMRLAYFNVLEEERQQARTPGEKSYMGLPVTCAALIFPAVYILQYRLGLQSKMIYELVMAAVAAAFIIAVKIKKPGKLGMGCLAIIGVLEFCILVMGGIA